MGDSFTALDEDYIYVGLFAGRKSTHVRFSDVKFEINDDADYSRVDGQLKKRNVWIGFSMMVLSR